MKKIKKLRLFERQNRQVSIRIKFLAVIFGVLMFVPLLAQLYDIAIARHNELEGLAVNQATRTFPIAAGRGTIFDRNGNVLAISASVETVCISPVDISRHSDPDGIREIIADGLSEILGVDRDMVVTRMARTGRANEIILRDVERETANEVRQFIADNNLNRLVFLEPSTRRYYPNSAFASGVIGFVGRENTGLMGVEAVFDELLTGTPGRTVRARTGSGSAMPNQFEMFYDAIDGYDVFLTIDETLQHFAEKHLETAVIENEVAERGAMIVMDVNTGAVLAMATKGGFDLNNPHIIADQALREYIEALDDESRPDALAAAQQAQWRNKAVNDTYEPGSVFKIFTAAMALEENVYNLETANFVCTGSVEIGGFTIRCHRRGGHGPTQNFTQVMTHSCNPAFIDMANRIGPARFYDYMHAFGFMDRTGIELQGEATSIVAPFETFSQQASAQAVYSFGQTFRVTPMQMITAVSAVANGGALMRPHVFSHALDAEGRIRNRTEPTEVRQVVSAETSRILREILEESVSSGTGSNAYVQGFNIAGKTGTSQKRDIPNSDDLGLYVVSFAGFAPAHDPQIALLVLLDEPGLTRTQRMGGYMAAPVAGRFFADALPYLGLTPQFASGENAAVDVVVPFVRRTSIDNAAQLAEDAGLTVRVVGDGAEITDQLPAAGVRVPSGTEMILYTEGLKPDDVVVVPDVRGMSPEAANTELINAGVFMRPIGAQPARGTILTASWQEFTGTEVPYGTVINVEFRSMAVTDN